MTELEFIEMERRVRNVSKKREQLSSVCGKLMAIANAVKYNDKSKLVEIYRCRTENDSTCFASMLTEVLSNLKKPLEKEIEEM